MRITRRRLTFLVLIVSACSERIEVKYGSFGEAVEAGAVERGWIPDFLPSSSTQIRDVHDLDTNEGWLRFEYASEDREALVGRLIPASTSELTAAPLRDPRVDWWDHERLLALAEGEAGASVYRSVESNRLVLLLPTHGEGYVWLYR